MKANNYLNYGLHNGAMGNVIHLLCDHSVSKDKEKRKLAKKILNDAIVNIANVNDYSFNNGLLGIGWGIQWILSQKIIDADADDILEDLDAEVFKLIMYSKSENLSLETGAMGRVLYIYDRITYPFSKRNQYQEVPLREVLMLTLDEFYHHIVMVDGEQLSLRKPLDRYSDVKYLLQIAQALSICIKIQKIMSVRYIYDLHPLLNTYIHDFIFNCQKQDDFNFSPELLTLIDSYKESLAYLNDKTKMIVLSSFLENNKNKVTKKQKSKVYKGWYKEIATLAINPKLINWKDGWLIC